MAFRVSSHSIGSGNAGSLSVFARTVDLNGGEIQSLADEGSTGAGGNVKLEVEDVTLRNGGQISVSTRGAGKAGALERRELAANAGA